MYIHYILLQASHTAVSTESIARNRGKNLAWIRNQVILHASLSNQSWLSENDGQNQNRVVLERSFMLLRIVESQENSTIEFVLWLDMSLLPGTARLLPVVHWSIRKTHAATEPNTEHQHELSLDIETIQCMNLQRCWIEIYSNQESGNIQCVHCEPEWRRRRSE